MQKKKIEKIMEILKKSIKKTKFSFVHFCGLEKCLKSIKPSGLFEQ